MEIVLIVAGTAGALAVVLVLFVRSRSGSSDTPVAVWEMRGQVAVPVAPRPPLADVAVEPDEESGTPTEAHELEDAPQDQDEEESEEPEALGELGELEQRIEVTSTDDERDDTGEREAGEQDEERDEENLLDWDDEDDER